MRVRIVVVLLGAGLVIGLVIGMAGCGRDSAEPADRGAAGPTRSPSSPGSPTGSPGLSNPSLPILPSPSGPPREPTDTFKPVWFTGLVVAGDSRCLVLALHDGRRFALHNPDGLPLRPGDRVSVKMVGGVPPTVDCGDDPVMRVLEVRPTR